jgi:hypothetical protein
MVFANRERTLVLLAASTGLRQSELFGLKWGDINFAERTMNVTRSIVCGVVGPAKQMGQMHGYDATQIGTVVIWLRASATRCIPPNRS